ncbi:MAG: hypothetical protein AAFO96_28755 [Bacteroidota bacterium]
MNITYSGCVNTFHHDEIVVEKPFNLKEKLMKSKKPLRVPVYGSSIQSVMENINTRFDGVLKLEMDAEKKFCKWVVNDYPIIISQALMNLFGLWQDVISKWDMQPVNYHELEYKKRWEDMDYHITIIPDKYKATKWTLKRENEKIRPEDFVVRFYWMMKDYLHIEREKNRFTVTKLYDDNVMILFSEPLHRMTSFRQAGFYSKRAVHFGDFDFGNSFRPAWDVFLFDITETEPDSDRMKFPITLPPHTFERQSDAIAFLNKAINDANISISLMKDGTLRLSITDEGTSITFSNTLRDILAFDHNTYRGRKAVIGSGTFSLARRIHYLYVYSSVSDYVRIGDTEAPLLAVIPFNPEVCVNLLQEKTFKTPMYVPVIQNPISQIDIAIYDGAGELVPFAGDAVTSLRLHFRQL